VKSSEDFSRACGTVSQNSILLVVGNAKRPGKFERDADYKSAILQNTILRYAFGKAGPRASSDLLQDEAILPPTPVVWGLAFPQA
jgi:hypothetical protein